MLVVLAAAALVFVSGSISALNRDLAQRPAAAPPSTTARPSFTRLSMTGGDR
ncbi:hypothetical protein MLP_40270 [Microlunatus phosphovorus NM-1]|uniref:Uncharacterized protein n=1 Tax=Microlunatus phosphovorus (strain ATCC 700054 / DSM 10555 / JCM 9379 / NBRC 101784 / NCIMB 13414 / VKM Ac-1990 / NM-1) TaxID=1032480 RepID=F5XR19_MICPN|nr:hypothetical protein MLP_40270 [Microlunatus phosphovorus NM-1]